MSTRRAQKYTTTYKKRRAARQDPYAMQRAPKGAVVCPDCHAVFVKKRWTFDERAYARLATTAGTRSELCPACRKIRDDYPEGILTITWTDLKEHERDLMGLLRNEEARATAVNPLERIMKTIRRRDTLEVQTTNDRLAQRLGRELARAYKGKVTYRWPHEDKLVRVEWSGPASATPAHTGGARRKR